MGFPLHFILFGRIYIYGGMAPSFDFVVVIGIFCLSHKASKFEQWWPNILEPCDFTSLVGGQRLCLHQCLWQYVRLFLKKIMRQLAYLWINNMPCWLSINWIRLKVERKFLFSSGGHGNKVVGEDQVSPPIRVFVFQIACAEEGLPMLIQISGDANADLDIIISRTDGSQLRTVESFDLIQSNVVCFVCPQLFLSTTT